jgi:adenylate cyclase
MGLIVAIIAARADVLGEIDLARGRVLYAVAAFVLVMAVGAAAAARLGLARPLGKVAENLRALEDFRPEGIRPVVSRLSEIGLLSTAIGRMSTSLTSFRKYIPTDVVRTLFSQGIEAELGGERRDLTILFMDLAGFTRLSESMGEGIIPLLGDYLSAMSEEIGAKDGTIDKYIGDAVMAFWGAPRPQEQHAEMACRAALACARRLAASNAEATGGRPALRARIGLNTGSVLVGNFGSRERLNYTVIGDAVNVASRLEALNKTYGTGILIGEATYRAAKHAIVARRLGRVAVYGRGQGALVYELVGLAHERAAETEAWIAAFEEGLDLLDRRDWDGAIARFERVLAMRRGDDGPSHLLIERARTFKVAPPPPDWDGLSVMERK